jgi:hypothetical protein
MKIAFPLLVVCLLVGACAPQSAAASSADCPVTQPPQEAFSLPKGYQGTRSEPYPGKFWYGSPGLWTMLPEDGIWAQLPRDEHGFTQKIFWWADGYDWIEDSEPVFRLTGERLDGKAPQIDSREATNANTSETGSSILTGILIPTAGCWRITGEYRGAELSFVVFVKEP